jgi:hypothetical protein
MNRQAARNRQFSCYSRRLPDPEAHASAEGRRVGSSDAPVHNDFTDIQLTRERRSTMKNTELFKIHGSDGGALELPGTVWTRQPAGARRGRKQTFYHQRINFRLPTGSTVNLIVVITTRRKWETKMEDKTGWTVIPFLKNWVVVLQLLA